LSITAVILTHQETTVLSQKATFWCIDRETGPGLLFLVRQNGRHAASHQCVFFPSQVLRKSAVFLSELYFFFDSLSVSVRQTAVPFFSRYFGRTWFTPGYSNNAARWQHLFCAAPPSLWPSPQVPRGKPSHFNHIVSLPRPVGTATRLPRRRKTAEQLAEAKARKAAATAAAEQTAAASGQSLPLPFWAHHGLARPFPAVRQGYPPK